jgi:hypothetical protein
MIGDLIGALFSVVWGVFKFLVFACYSLFLALFSSFLPHVIAQPLAVFGVIGVMAFFLFIATCNQRGIYT